MKNKYIQEIKDYLQSKGVLKEEIDQIISDYESIYDEALESGLTDEEIIEKLGDPKSIYSVLKEDLTRKITVPSKITGVMVFLAVIAFVLIGQLTNVWHPTWLVFMAIPLSGILTSVSSIKHKIIGSLPFISLIIYFTVSHFYTPFYLYGWPVFLLTLIGGMLDIKSDIRKIIMLVLFVLTIALYYVLSIITQNWYLPLLLFIVPVIYGLFINVIKIQVKLLSSKILLSIGIAIVLTYFIVSILTKAWAWSWVILLVVPMLSVYEQEKFSNPGAYIPFISVILFFLIGYFIEGGWTYSWMFLLANPIVTIIYPKKRKVDEANIIEIPEEEEEIEEDLE